MSDVICGYAPAVTVTGNVISWAKAEWDKKLWTECFSVGDYVANLSLGTPAAQQITAIPGEQSDGSYQITVSDASGWSTDDRCAPQRQATIYWYTTIAAGSAACVAADWLWIYYASASPESQYFNNDMPKPSGGGDGWMNAKPFSVVGGLSNQRVSLTTYETYPIMGLHNANTGTWPETVFRVENITVFLRVNPVYMCECYHNNGQRVEVSRLQIYGMPTGTSSVVMTRNIGANLSNIFMQSYQGVILFVYNGAPRMEHCTGVGIQMMLDANERNPTVVNCLAINCRSFMLDGDIAIGKGNRSTNDDLGGFIAEGCENNVGNVSIQDIMPVGTTVDRNTNSGFLESGSLLDGVGSTDTTTTIDIYGATRPTPPTPGVNEPVVFIDEAARNTDPGIANVLDGVDYLIQNVAKQGMHEEAVSTDPGVVNVLKDVAYTINDAAKVGTFDEAARNTDPGIANVKLAETYKILNIDYVGSYVAGGVLTPSLAIANGIATITGAEPTYTNVLVFTITGENSWHALSYITGNGTIAITGLSDGSYTARVMSISSPGTVSDSVDFSITNSTVSSNINADWSRWIFASVSYHFDQRKGSLDMFIEGQHRDTRTLKDFFELRVDGPYYTELSKNYWQLYIEVNALVQSTKDDHSYHRIWDNCGTVSAMFTDIPVYKYGNGILDDQSYLGCLNLLQDTRGRERLQTSHFGQIEPKTPILQATIEGHYEMHLSV